ncbi:MAG: 3-dehydroquinate [Desulfovibrionaceae bacterium]|nr:MAG: 3-dehydroquinate [Desulfovibrionaceae bacterium]
MSEPLVVSSHKGPYEVVFDEDALELLARQAPAKARFIVDANVAALHAGSLEAVLPQALVIEATEKNKSLDRMPDYVAALLERGTRRGDVLTAIGGGIIQDITCFLAATLFRGLPWHFYPTTLLAQADSCIGSKSSINVGRFKNIMGTFTPPDRVFVTTQVLKTLDRREMLSGVGEMLKVHAIDGPQSFDALAARYHDLLEDAALLRDTVRRSLLIKQRFIEEDEFDKGVRNIMNYGHSFGHAIESATEFGMPHGIAVSMGMDMANWVAVGMGVSTPPHFARMHPVLAENFSEFRNLPIPVEPFLAALAKDKKNTEDRLRLILPGQDGRLFVGLHANDQTFRSLCATYLEKVRQE